MPASSILSASWDKYEQKKALSGQDAAIFCPENVWEFNYLLDTIVREKPSLDIITVMLSIRRTMRETVAPRLRQKFVEAVMENVSERETSFLDLVENSARIAS